MTDKQRVYEEKLEAQWQEWKAQISRFKTKTERAKAEVEVNDTPPKNLPPED